MFSGVGDKTHCNNSLQRWDLRVVDRLWDGGCSVAAYQSSLIMGDWEKMGQPVIEGVLQFYCGTVASDYNGAMMTPSAC